MTRRALATLGTSSYWWRILRLNLGLMLLGYSIALMLEANIGVGPWTVFHEGLSHITGISYGRATQLTGFAVLAFAVVVTRTRPGIGTVINMLLVGPWVDLFRGLPAVPTATGPWWGLVQFAIGLVLSGVATGLYITARLGEGPRDGLALGIARLIRSGVRTARLGLEVLALTSGWLMGGSVGVGTVIFAFGIGPMMQYFLRLFGHSDDAAARTRARPSTGDRSPDPVAGPAREPAPDTTPVARPSVARHDDARRVWHPRRRD